LLTSQARCSFIELRVVHSCDTHLWCRQTQWQRRSARAPWTPHSRVACLTHRSITCAALVGVLSATIVEFNKVDPSAAKLLLPYLGWTLFASALNYNIWANNKEDGTEADGPVKQTKEHGTVKQVWSTPLSVYLRATVEAACAWLR